MHHSLLRRLSQASMVVFVALLGVGCLQQYNVRSYGASGNGTSLDSPAINNAINSANKAGGGTVYFPAGQYLSTSIRLKSNVCLYLDQGAVILAADTAKGYQYDLPEPNEWDPYEDFGHSHWQNSLIWGDGLENVSIMGPGEIYGKGLVRSGREARERKAAATQPASRPSRRSSTGPASRPATRRAWGPPTQPSTGPAVAATRPLGQPATSPATPFGYPNPEDSVENGWGNKAIALKLCRNVIMRDFTIRHGGHFAILATGVDNFTLDNLKIDTNRDGMDIDCCRNVRISNCTVNSPSDDAICLKSCYSLGFPKPCENITITNCQVSGYDEGSLLDGTMKRDPEKAATNVPTGRIKFGTESNGGFKNITISNCVFEFCRGLALETVDGALLEDVTITNITMRDIVNAPFYLRLGARMRGPEGRPVGELRRVTISNIVCYNADPRYGSIISGIPGNDIKDIRLSDIRIYYKGGGWKELATSQPVEGVRDYPEPRNFGDNPAYGFYVRHVKGIEFRDVEVSYLKDEQRPPFILEDVKGVEFNHVKAQHADGVPTFVLKKVTDFSTFQTTGVEDAKKASAEEEKF